MAAPLANESSTDTATDMWVGWKMRAAMASKLLQGGAKKGTESLQP